MPTDPFWRDVIANAILILFIAAPIGAIVWRLTEKRRERARARRFHETRIRL